MKISVEVTLNSFEFWSGAIDNANKLTYDEMEQLELILDEVSDSQTGYTDTDINDLFWFDFEHVCGLLGLEYDDETDEIIR